MKNNIQNEFWVACACAALKTGLTREMARNPVKSGKFGDVRVTWRGLDCPIAEWRFPIAIGNAKQVSADFRNFFGFRCLPLVTVAFRAGSVGSKKGRISLRPFVSVGVGWIQ